MPQNYVGTSDGNDRPTPVMKSLRSLSNFKNPPQPHMCIRDSTKDGNELFINVLSWNKIAMPKSAQDPIPLYGGMRVPPTSANTPPLVFAVMANPDILKTNGRLCKDPVELMALVELMCDFVEAMNPGLTLKRQAEVLPERELSGELKDVWTAIQYKRESECSNYSQSKPPTQTQPFPSDGGPQYNNSKMAKFANNSDKTLKIYQIDRNPNDSNNIINGECNNDLRNSKNSSSNALISTKTDKDFMKAGKDFFRNDFFPQFKTKKFLNEEFNSAVEKDNVDQTNNTQVIRDKVCVDADINISKLNLE